MSNRITEVHLVQPELLPVNIAVVVIIIILNY